MLLYVLFECYIIVLTGKSFVKIESRFQTVLFFLFYWYFQSPHPPAYLIWPNVPTPLPPHLLGPPVYSVPKSIDVLLRHIQAYSALHVTLACSQPCHIPYIQNYPGNSEPWHIGNPGIFRTLTYLNPTHM